MCEVETITKIAKTLGVAAGEVKLNSEKIITRTNNNKTVSGFATILNTLAQESKSEIARNSTATRETAADVYQWIEFAVLYVAPGSKDKHVSQQLLRDFNKLFTTKSYLVGHFITLADLAIFYAISNLVKSLSPVDKENYLNLSRWFDHLQQRPEIRQGGNVLNFTTIYLHGWATGTHI
ncbi:eukaryotic translation elongation factor 1 epsilon-1 [Zeugodacus cucurbitae]|uniref:eukaryotic translation elongation factor 1 epsilon-1 n=1 Tax=Zeugodacus cucurbitae TaxID=28588 RepID=UPI0005968F0A|nr:eukaryotic translation elongation factor 1 epsilon-1 [Zeugodacus cucurbitae]